MSTVSNSDTNPFETIPLQSKDESTILSETSNTIEHQDSGELSDSESVVSVSSTGSNSGKKKLIIKTKKRSNSSDSDDVSDTSEKKPRKPRTTKPNELEKYGFNPELTWNFPKMKKYMDDKSRTCVSSSNIIKSTKSSNDYDTSEDEVIGLHVTFRKGVKEENILFITKFEPEWLNDTKFSNYINSFAGKSSKSSRLVIIHSSAKAWGAKKVTEAITKLRELEAASKLANITTGSHTINFSGPDNNKSTEVVEVEQVVPSIPSKKVTMGTSIDFNAEISRLTKIFQEQTELAARNYQAELAKLALAVAQSTT